MIKEGFKNFFKAVIFITGLFVILFLLKFVLKPNKQDELQTDDLMVDRAVEASKEEDLDIVYVGDSLSISSIDPRVVEEEGYSMFVCGSVGQSLTDTQNIVLELNEQTDDYVLIMEANNFFYDYGVNDVLDNYISENSVTVKYHDRWKDVVSDTSKRKKKERNKKDSQSTDYRGYKSNDLVQPADSVEAKSYMADYGKAEEIDYVNRQMIETIVNDCRANNVEVVFVSSPSVSNWSMAKHRGIKKLARELDVDYIDCNLANEIGINWQTDTRDGGDHLNNAGAEKTTKYMMRQLKKRGWL